MKLRHKLAMTALLAVMISPSFSVAKDGPSQVEKKYHDLGFKNNTVSHGDTDAAKELEKTCNKHSLIAGRNRRSVSIMTTGGDPIARPDSPYIDVDPDKVEGYAGRDIDETTKKAIRSLGLENRLKITDPLSLRLRKVLRKRQAAALDSRAGALVYDDGSVKQEMFNLGFENYFNYLGKLERKGLFALNNPYKCDLGNHASAVTATLLQACPSIQYHITVIGGDGKKGDFSDGPSIDNSFTKRLIQDLSNDAIRHSTLHNPVVLNASYGYDAKGDFKDALDEGGIWKSLWDKVAGSVVVQAAGNESTNLTVTDANLAANNAFETALNMRYTMSNPAYRGRLIHAIASIPDFNTGANTMAVSFSNYYSHLDTKFVHFARDHSMMAPGEYCFIPMDPFDSDQDREFHVDPNELNEWSGTSAAAPMITGAILRLVNEFGLTAHKAAAILLETADHVYEKKAKGEVKSMNLGAAIRECIKREIYKAIALPSNNFTEFTTNILPTYFGDKSAQDLSVEERNFLYDIADRAGNVYVLPESSKSSSKYSKLYDWKQEEVAGSDTENKQFYYKKGSRDVLYTYFFIAPDRACLKTIEVEKTNEPRVVDFRLTYTNSIDPPKADEFTVKGVLGTELNVHEIDGTDQAFIVSVKIPDNFTSQRTLSLHAPYQLILGQQNNSAYFDGTKFVY